MLFPSEVFSSEEPEALSEFFRIESGSEQAAEIRQASYISHNLFRSGYQSGG
jgi:hypothetical protein